MHIIAYLLIVLCSLFGNSQDSYNLSNGITVNNTDKVLVWNSASFGEYSPTSDKCTYQLIVVNMNSGDSIFILQRNCNRCEFSANLSFDLPKFNFVEF